MILFLRRLTKFILSMLLASILLACLLFIFLITPSGLQVITKLTNHFASETITIQGARGSLDTTIFLKKLTLHSGTHKIVTTNVSLNISPWDLLLGHINVNRLQTKAMHITTASVSTPITATTPSSSTLALPSLSSLSEQLNTIPQTYAFPSWLTLHALRIQSITMLSGTQTTLNIQSIIGTLKTTGAVSTFKLSLKGTLPVATSIALQTKGNREAYTATINAAYGTLHAHCKLTITPTYLTLLPSTISNGSGLATLSMRDHMGVDPTLTMHSHFKQFPIHNQMLNGMVTAHLDPQKITSLSLSLKGKPSTQYKQDTMQLTLRHDQQWIGRWTIAIGQLQQWLPFIKGSLTTQGSFHSHLFKSIGRIHLDQLHYNDIDLKAFKSDWSLNDTLKKETNTVLLSIQQLNTSDIALQNSTLRASGSLQKHTITLALTDTNHQRLQTQLSGDYDADKKNWIGTLSHTQFQQSTLPAWTQAKPSALTIDSDGITVDAFSLKDNTHFIQLSGNYSLSHDWSVKSTGNIPGTWPAITNNILRKATLTWDGTLHGDQNKLTDVSLTTKLSSILAPLSARAPNYLPIAIAIQSHWKNNTLTAVTKINSNHKSILTAQAHWQHFNLNQPATLATAAMTIKTNAAIQEKPLQNLIHHFEPTITSKGALTLTSTLSGSLYQPNLTLEAKHVGELALPLLGSTLKNSLLHITTQQHVMHITTGLDYNKHPLTLTGTVTIPTSTKTLNASAAWKSVWKFKTTAFDAIQTQDQQATVIPDLTMHCVNSDCNLTGSVTIPKATIQVNKVSSSTTLPTNDINYVTSNSDEASLQHFTYNIQLTLGDAVQVSAYNFKGNANGTIQVSKTNNTPLLLNGRIAFLKASYTFQKTVLPVTTADITYVNAPTSNPMLQITAERTIRIYALPNTTQQNGNLTVGLHITGFLSKPNIQLYSYPANLSKQDILSYLLLGQSASTGGLLSTAAFFAMSDADLSNKTDIISDIKSWFGLSEFGVEQNSSFDNSGNIVGQQNQFVIGKHLFNKIYLRYSIGLGDSYNLLMLIYQINKHWSIQSTQGIQTSSNIGSAIDLMYQFSRP